jgi:hypothetical protein
METIAYELHRQFRLPHWNILVSRHQPENFLVRFDYPDQCDAIIHAGSIAMGSAVFQIHLWHLESYTRPADWFYHVRNCIELLPIHAWSANGVRQVLNDVCVFDHMDAASFCQDNTKIFSCHAWMRNPDLLPRSKVVTFFTSCAGWASPNDGPPPAAVTPVPLHPVGISL